MAAGAWRFGGIAGRTRPVLEDSKKCREVRSDDDSPFIHHRQLKLQVEVSDNDASSGTGPVSSQSENVEDEV
jgi:hypothetical protein